MQRKNPARGMKRSEWARLDRYNGIIALHRTASDNCMLAWAAFSSSLSAYSHAALRNDTMKSCPQSHWWSSLYSNRPPAQEWPRIFLRVPWIRCNVRLSQSPSQGSSAAVTPSCQRGQRDSAASSLLNRMQSLVRRSSRYDAPQAGQRAPTTLGEKNRVCWFMK